MYPRKLSTLGHLKSSAEIRTLKHPFRYLYTQNLSNKFWTVKDVRKRLLSFLKEKILKSSNTNNYYSNNLLNLLNQQCEYISAERIKKGFQMFTSYSKYWEEISLKKKLAFNFRNSAKKYKKEMLLGSVTLAAFEWEKYRIQEKDMRCHMNDFTYVYTLRDKTLCQGCFKTNPSENTENICHCDDYKSPNPPLRYDNWETFIEKKDLVVWRRLHESGHYEYKVYGSYNDVSAEEFLNVQVDTDYRRIWDTTAIVLEIVEKDPEPKNNSDIIYWEMLWPMMFANRDYVFVRRYLVDYNTKTILMANKSIPHPKYPDKPDKFRVKDYWSYMVIKPYTEMNKHGIEFVLTYYDNPGVSIPSKVTTWVAMRAMPDFLERLREAAKKYKSYCKQAGVKCISLLEEGGLTEEEHTEDYLHYFLDNEEDLITDNTISEAQHNLKRHYKKRNSDPPKSDSRSLNNDNDLELPKDPSPPTSPMVQRGTKHFWKYLNPSFYIS